MKSLSKFVKAGITSYRLGFFLIGLLLLLILISAVIPQKDVVENQILDLEKILGDKYIIIEWLGLDRIYFSPLFFITLALLAISITVVNIKRFKLILKVEKTLIKAKYLGSIIFHLSLLLIIAGIILNYLYKFNGVFAMTEGQALNDSELAYFRIFKGPFQSDESGRFVLKLEKVHDDYKIKDTFGEAAEISLVPSTGESELKAHIFTNNPLKWKNLEFHFGLVTGYSPEVVVMDTSGNHIFKNFVRLATRKIEAEKVYSDFVILLNPTHKIEIEVVPDIEATYNINVADETETLYKGVLNSEDTVSFDGYEVTIPRLRRWCYVDVIESPFLNLVFTGFWMAIAGLVISFVPRLIDQMKDAK